LELKYADGYIGKPENLQRLAQEAEKKRKYDAWLAGAWVLLGQLGAVALLEVGAELMGKSFGVEGRVLAAAIGSIPGAVLGLEQYVYSSDRAKNLARFLPRRK